jgi:hypothetical protein
MYGPTKFQAVVFIAAIFFAGATVAGFGAFVFWFFSK